MEIVASLAAATPLAVALKEPILKLIDVCSNGIGKVYEPIHVVRMAKAHAKEIDLISAASNKNIDLPILYSSGDIKIDTTSDQQLAARTQTRLQYQEMQNQQNIEAVISHAYDELETEETVAKEPVDKEWSTRFFNIAGDISSDELQLLWGRVLSGEIKQPGSYSLRTLEVLRNLSKTEAEIFSKIANYVFNFQNIFFIDSDANILKSENIVFTDLSILDEARLIVNNGLTTVATFDKNHETQFVQYGEKLLLIKRNNEQLKELTISHYSLTSAGAQIYSIIENSFKEDYFKNVAKKFKDQNTTVSYTNTIKNNNGVSYDKTKCIII